MKRRILFLLAIVLMSVPALQAGPKIVVTEGTYQFGKIIQHAVANKRFWIKSIGDTPAKIIEAKPDCGCTELLLKDSTIAPGDSAAIDVIFHSRAFIGYLSKKPSIRIAGSDEVTNIMFYVEVITHPGRMAPLAFTPEKVDVSQFTETPRRKGTLIIENTSTEDYTVKVIDTAFKSFTVKGMPTVLKAGQKAEVQVIVRKDRVPTAFEEAFTFQINDGGGTRYTIPIQRIYAPKRADGKLSGS